MKGRNEIRFVISRFSPSHFLNVELKLFLSKMIIFRAKKKMKEDLFRGCPRRSTIHSRKESTGVVSGCRESNEISPIYTLANNRGDRDDLWPPSTLIYRYRSIYIYTHCTSFAIFRISLSLFLDSSCLEPDDPAFRPD